MKHTKAVQARKRLTIKTGVASAKRGFPRPSLRRVAIVGGCIVLFLTAFAAAAHDTIERMVVERSLASAFGGDASIATLSHADGETIVEGVRAQTADGAATVTIERATYTVNGDVWTVKTDGVHVTVAVDRIGGDEFSGAPNAAHVLTLRRLVLQVKNASIAFARSADAASKVDIAGVNGTIDASARITYDARGSLITDTGAYPLSANAVADSGEGVDARWTAAVLPLAPLAALLGNANLTVRDGEARDVTFTSAGGLHGTFSLANVRASIAGQAVHALTGPVTVVRDGIGSTGLDALLDDGAPVAAVGEVHDGRDWGHMLSSGTRDLGALTHMFAMIAVQPNLRWMNVETTAPGITFGQYAMTAKTVPHVVQMIAVDPHEPTVRFDTALSHERVISGGERTSDLGLRTKAVAGANGDYFDIGRTYEPQGLLIKSGVLFHGPTDHEAVIFDRTNKPTFARFRLVGSVVDGARTYPVTLYNSWPTRDVAIITPDYGKLLPAAPGVSFEALQSLGEGKYRVLSMQPMTAAIPVTFGLGFSDRLNEPLPNVGDVLDLHYAIDPAVPGAMAGIGSGPLLLKDGVWFEDHHAPAPDERDVQWPVVAIGTMPGDTLMFVAVDGRHPERSIGMTRPEFGDLLRSFGMIDAMALDSGGSVTLVSRAPGNSAVTVRNVVSDFSQERYVTDALFVYSTAPLGTIVTSPRPHVEPTPLIVPAQ
jgi:exopolysaccharide biosynthesis protein